MVDCLIFVDNNMWNNIYIVIVGKVMSLCEEVSYFIMCQYEVDYVFVVFGGFLGYFGDDINKFLWMVCIVEGIWFDEVSECVFFILRGEYCVDGEVIEIMKNSLM